jgi:acetylornithine/N-succinyldiaminopimelate aminotransferase
MAIAKGIGGGFPIGAFLATEEASKGMVPGTHGSTFGGNPLAVAVGNAVLDVLLEDGFLDNVDKTGRLLWDRLSETVARYPDVYESVRGAGLMIGIKCVVPAGDVVVAFQKEGMLTVPAGDNVARLLPPLNIEESHIDEAITIIDRVGKNWAAGDG